MGKSIKKNYYVVVRGRKRGLYYQWFGEGGAADQVKGLSDRLFKGFYTLEEARNWLLDMEGVEDLLNEIDSILANPPVEAALLGFQDYQGDLAAGKIVIFTDGGCEPNPGPGGYGVVLLYKEYRRELSGGFRLTTNNRMELLACIEGLRALKRECPVVLYSDSKYVVDAINLGWARRWREKNWYRTQTHKAENADLWEQLLSLCETYTVEFRWVKGHAGIPENERCDQLAVQMTTHDNLPPDSSYEEGTTRTEAGPLEITEEGQPCLKCGTPVIKRTPRRKYKRGHTFYYEYFLYCPECKTAYIVESAKREFDSTQLSLDEL